MQCQQCGEFRTLLPTDDGMLLCEDCFDVRDSNGSRMAVMSVVLLLMIILSFVFFLIR